MNRIISIILAVLFPTSLFALGLLVGRHYYPRYVQVPIERKIIKEVPVGSTRVVRVPVPVEKVKTVEKIREIPVEVTRYKERVVTVTKPLPVPVEVVKQEWPQMITVKVGSVLTTEDKWVTPKFPELVIGQISPGVYAVPQQEGWKIEEVRTEVKVSAEPPKPTASLSFGPTVGIIHVGGVSALAVGAEVRLTKEKWDFRIAGGYSTSGRWVEVFATYRFP